MTHFNWSAFLARWNQKIIESKKRSASPYAASQRLETWLGYPGATEQQILEAEARLGVSLPPSYRAFLKTSNGWQETTPFINRLFCAEEITWFAQNHPDWLLYEQTRRDRNLKSTDNNVSNRPSAVSDKEYFVYGEAQDCRQIRAEYLETALEISEVKDSAIYLLNSEVMTEDGEWEAWFLADWLPGADRYPSFQALMQAEYFNSCEIRSSPSAIKSDGEGK